MKTDIVQLTFRLPVDVHQSVKVLAEQEERSLNNMLIRLLREALAGKPFPSYTENKTFQTYSIIAD